MKKNRPIIGAIAIAVLLVASACATSNDSPAADPGPDALIAPGVLSVCISKNGYPPLYFKEDGELKGFDVESTQAIADELGVKLSWLEVAFDGLIPSLTTGRCDLMRSGLYISEERLKVADGIPYLATGPGLVVTKGNPHGITSADDLSGLRVAAQAASANAKILQELSDKLVAEGKQPISIEQYPELPETVAAVQNGKADALIETDIAAAAVATSQAGSLEFVTGVFKQSTDFGMYLAKDNPLLTDIKKAAKVLSDDGTFAAIAEKYGIDPDNLAS